MKFIDQQDYVISDFELEFDYVECKRATFKQHFILKICKSLPGFVSIFTHTKQKMLHFAAFFVLYVPKWTQIRSVTCKFLDQKS